MRGYDVDEVTRRDHSGFLPEPWEMPLVSGYQVVGTGNVGAFQKFIVVGIRGDS
jgi:hypothetical protein